MLSSFYEWEEKLLFVVDSLARESIKALISVFPSRRWKKLERILCVHVCFDTNFCTTSTL